MVDYVIARALAWMELEPVVGLMMTVAAVVTFAGVFRRAGGPDPGPWAFVRRVVDATVAASLLMGLLWAFRAVLHDNATGFGAEHGRVSEANLQSVRTIWGGPHVQRELSVDHFEQITVREEQFRDDPTLPPVFRESVQESIVEHDSITRVRADIDVVPNQRRKGSGIYSGFEARFALHYTVRSPAKATERSLFTFPLSGQVLYEDLTVQIDGVDVGEDLVVDSTALRWERPLGVAEEHEVTISYATRGTELVYYQIPEAREIRDLAVHMRVHDLGVESINYPGGCLTPTTIEDDADGVSLRWELDHALTTAGMGVAMPQPEQPGASVTKVLERSPHALMLLVGAACLVLLVEVGAVALLDVALSCASYALLFVLVAATSDATGGLLPALAIAVVPTMLTLWWLWRRHPSHRVVLGLCGFFVVVHPLTALSGDALDTVDAAVVAGLVLLLVVLTLRARLREAPEKRHDARTPTLEDLPLAEPPSP